MKEFNVCSYNDSGMIPDHPMYATHVYGAQQTILLSKAISDPIVGDSMSSVEEGTGRSKTS